MSRRTRQNQVISEALQALQQFDDDEWYKSSPLHKAILDVELDSDAKMISKYEKHAKNSFVHYIYKGISLNYF